jgi:DNA-binding Lrp family transcriptional regulator
MEKTNKDDHPRRDTNAKGGRKEVSKEKEVAIVAELMRNSRRSDRELAKVIGASQPTVSRIMDRLEKQGVIREYTMIPDFKRLGYTLCAFTFLKLKDLPPEGIEKVRQAVKESVKKSRFAIILLERGIGLNRDAVMVSLYRDYASYAEHRRIIAEFPYINPTDIESFLIDLSDEVHYRYLSLQSIARDLQTHQEGNQKLQQEQTAKEKASQNDK